MSTSPPPGNPPVDKHSCRLLGPTALVVQALMGVLVLLSLAYKRQREAPKRPWKIWLFDVSKQVCGQLFVHGSNVLVADLISHHSSSNACITYFLNILVDTTLGVAIIYLMLRVLAFITMERLRWDGFQSGVYGTPPSIKFWARQTAMYIVALSSMKFIVIVLLGLFPFLDNLAEWLLSWTVSGDDDSLQVIFTMGLFPIMMNILQFWLIDSIVKAKSNLSHLNIDNRPDGLSRDDDREPLFQAPPDDEDEHSQRYDEENPRIPPNHRSKDTPSLPNGNSNYDASSAITSTTHTGGSVIHRHDYPPSMSSSTASLVTTGAPVIKQATKLNRKLAKTTSATPSPRASRTNSATASPQPPSQVPATLAPSNNDWDDAWGDEDDASKWNPTGSHGWETNNKTVSVS